MLQKIYRFILKTVKPLVKFTGKIRMPFSRKKFTGDMYYKVKDLIEEGTILLTSTYGEFSNIINPLDIKHGGIYIGKDEKGIPRVSEALAKGVSHNNVCQVR